MDIVDSYASSYIDLVRVGWSGAASIFKALEQFDTEDRREIASRLHEVIEFNFEQPSIQDLVRKNLKSISPDADLSWIPDWRKGYEALHASPENTN
ncbi:hypothetical protein YA0599_03375 [Pseudomonas syringae]|uniref:hypothetical protein n=1 Tax=Pseudomonas syringae TaxID=317 RepID=UPI0018E64FCB|nr:hypothetical protein [Pseudomonas syringae]MBI6707255.1 hypothetical protein [Pseudomonas syringae]